MKKLLIVGALLVAAGVGYYVLKPGMPGSGALSSMSTVGPLDYAGRHRVRFRECRTDAEGRDKGLDGAVRADLRDLRDAGQNG